MTRASGDPQMLAAALAPIRLTLTAFSRVVQENQHYQSSAADALSLLVRNLEQAQKVQAATMAEALGLVVRNLEQAQKVQAATMAAALGTVGRNALLIENIRSALLGVDWSHLAREVAGSIDLDLPEQVYDWDEDLRVDLADAVGDLDLDQDPEVVGQQFQDRLERAGLLERLGFSHDQLWLLLSLLAALFVFGVWAANEPPTGNIVEGVGFAGTAGIGTYKIAQDAHRKRTSRTSDDTTT